mmetsp:Transcript_29066/g.89955  ORF Transcript_29066/g.89955 Transcript_29066/m.89955 type:complete len:262 (+) Transcript_29066:202-987(+)
MPLLSLGDDALLGVLSFVDVGTLHASAASRVLRELAASQALAQARGSDEYVLRGRGIVRALATAMGTRPWAADEDPVYGTHPMVPRQLEVRVGLPGPVTFPLMFSGRHPDHDYRESHRWKVTSQPVHGACDGCACGIGVGRFVEYELPFQLRAASFQIGFGECMATRFTDWALEAFDPELELEDGLNWTLGDTTTDPWRVLFDSGGESPWGSYGIAGPIKTFQLDAPFEASRFRIRIVREVQCFHVRALELFGTILPPWSL